MIGVRWAAAVQEGIGLRDGAVAEIDKSIPNFFEGSGVLPRFEPTEGGARPAGVDDLSRLIGVRAARPRRPRAAAVQGLGSLVLYVYREARIVDGHRG